MMVRKRRGDSWNVRSPVVEDFDGGKRREGSRKRGMKLEGKLSSLKNCMAANRLQARREG